MKKKFRILVDLDDTLTNLIQVWVEKINQKFDTNVKFEDIADWDIAKFFPSVPKQDIFKVLSDKSIWNEVTPLAYSQEYLQKLKDDGHEILIVSASHYKDIQDKYEKIIQKYFPFIDWKDVVVTSRKELIQGDILIDDAIHNVEMSNHRYKFLMDCSHNQEFDCNKNKTLRVYNWVEIYDIISYLSVIDSR